MLSRVHVSPAAVGAVALVAAALGSFATQSATADQGTVASREHSSSTSAQPSDKPAHAQDGGVDVSRSYDRATLERQTALQASQRARALKDIDRKITARAADLQQEKKRQTRQADKRRRQWVLPVAGYRLTARFGQQSGMWSSGSHTGLDFAGPSGTEIVAIAAGTVKSAGYSGSYGNRTVITLVDGTEIWYCHQSRIVVKAGDAVLPGQLTGYTGATGNVTGPHLHLEVRPPGSSAIDPEGALREHGVDP